MLQQIDGQIIQALNPVASIQQYLKEDVDTINYTKLEESIRCMQQQDVIEEYDAFNPPLSGETTD